MKCKPTVAVLSSFIALTSATTWSDSAVVSYPGSGNSYQRFDETLSWSAARGDCVSRGGHLATLTSSGEDNFVYANVGLPNGDVWLGATDEVSEGTWVWVTGEAWSYTNWDPNQPDNNGAGQDYLGYESNGTGGWDDAGLPDADFLQPYICEWEGGAQPVPVLSSWGLGLITLLIGGVGALISRKRGILTKS